MGGGRRWAHHASLKAVSVLAAPPYSLPFKLFPFCARVKAATTRSRPLVAVWADWGKVTTPSTSTLTSPTFNLLPFTPVTADTTADCARPLPSAALPNFVGAVAHTTAPKQLSVVERRLDEFSVEEAASSLWALGALGYTVSLKARVVVLCCECLCVCAQRGDVLGDRSSQKGCALDCELACTQRLVESSHVLVCGTYGV